MHSLLPTYNKLNGKPLDMINLPVSWVLDDAVFFQFHLSARSALRSARDVLETWKEEFRAIHASGGICVLTLHPQLSGRPSRVLMLKEFIEYVMSFDSVWIGSPTEAVDHWRSKYPLAVAA